MSTQLCTNSRQDLEAQTPALVLVHGNAGQLRGAANRAEALSEKPFDAATTLTYIETYWEGDAADAFNEYFAFQPPRFKEAGICSATSPMLFEIRQSASMRVGQRQRLLFRSTPQVRLVSPLAPLCLPSPRLRTRQWMTLSSF